jgi:hypothetical protein
LLKNSAGKASKVFAFEACVAERGHALEGRERARERIGLEFVVLECVEGVKNAGSAHARLEFLT